MGKTLEQKKGQVATVIKQYSWKIIFAKDLAEYDTLLNEMIMKAKTLGYDDILQWNIEQAKEIFEWRRRNN
jgi:putative aldouronate transport system substrate-binding protein